MRHTKIALFLLLGAVAASRIVHAQPPPDGEGDRRGGDNSSYGNAGDAGDPDQASVQYFHQRLSPYGRWEARAGYGDVWIPRVASGWRPYTTGHWVYTDQGWAWVANEPWGWAAFHYGRWYHDESSGWGWVPGHVWAPAWVAWRDGGGYLGWAPLPPAFGFTAGVGVDFGGIDIETAISPSFYSFVPERSILDARLSSAFVPFARNADCFRRSSNITRLTVVNNRVFNQGLNVQRVEQVTGRPVPRVRVGSQSYFQQPPVMVAAARQRGTEKFVGRPAPRAIVTANGNRVQTGRQPVANQVIPGRGRSRGSAPVTAPVQATRKGNVNANRDRSQAAPKAHPAHPQHPVKAEAPRQAVVPSHPQHAPHAAVQAKPRQQPPPQAKGQQRSKGKGQPQRQNKKQPVPDPHKPPA